MLSPDGTLISVSAAPHCRVISGLKETFVKKYLAERTNKAEIRPNEQREKAGSYWENLGTKIQSKGPQRQKQTHEQNKKKSGQARLVCVNDISFNIPTT